MTQEKLIDAITDLDIDILNRYFDIKADLAAKKKPKKRTWVKWASVAACFCIVVMSAILIPNILDRSDVSDVNPGKDFGATNGKLSISTITNAKEIKNAEYFLAERPSNSDIYTVEEYIEVLKNHFVTVTGSVTNMNSVAIQEGEFTWYITTFDININESIKQQIEADTITCVTVCKYYGDVSLNESKCGLSNVAYEITNNPTGFFVLRDVEDEAWNINGKSYNISDYADYYVGVRYDCTEEGFQYYGSTINFDDIRNNE